MFSKRQALLQRPRAMLEEWSGVVRYDRLKVRVLLTRSQRRTLQKRHPFIQNPDITGRPDVMSGGVCQPDPIIGNAGANAGAGRSLLARW